MSLERFATPETRPGRRVFYFCDYTSVMTKWVYITEQIYEQNLSEKLDSYGERGWELASIVILLPPEGCTDTRNLFLVICKQRGVVED